MLPRHLELHPKTTAYLDRLRVEAGSDGENRVATRIHAILLNSTGKTSGDIAKVLRVSRSQVSKWLKTYDQSGVQGILEGYRSGRPSLMTKENKILLSDIIESGPVAYGYMSGVWTSSMIAKIILTEFSVEYNPGHVRKILKEMKFSVQRPKKILANADPEKQDRWTRYTYPELKKSNFFKSGTHF